MHARGTGALLVVGPFHGQPTACGQIDCGPPGSVYPTDKAFPFYEGILQPSDLRRWAHLPNEALPQTEEASSNPLLSGLTLHEPGLLMPRRSEAEPR